MTIERKIIKSILIVLFILIGISALVGSIYLIWITAFGVGWGGGEITLFELMWKWKGFILISIYSFLASFGLIKNKKIGIILGYSVAIGFLLFTLVDMTTFSKGFSSMKYSDILWGIVFLGFPIFIIIGLTKIKKTLSKFKVAEYIVSVVLSILLFASFYFMLDY